MKSVILQYMLLLVSFTSYATQVNSDGTTKEVPMSTTATNYELTASPPSSEWTFTKGFSLRANGNGWYKVSPEETSYSAKYERRDNVTTYWVDSATVFGTVISGTMYKKTGGDGGTGEGALVYWGLKAAGSQEAKPAIYPSGPLYLPAGIATEFKYLFNGVEAPGGTWKYSGNTAATLSVNVSTVYGNFTGSGFSFPFAGIVPGVYNLSAARNTAGDQEAATDAISVVGVKQISAAHGSTTIISTTNTPGNNETLYVPKGASSITITATPEPGSSWPNGYPTWTLNGTSVGTAGNTTYSLSKATVGTYTVSAMCGTSKKAINVVVFGVDIYAETSAGVVNDGSMTSLTECMENRQITYTAKVTSNLPAGIAKTFTFHFQTANGIEWDSSVSSSNNIVNYIAVAGAVGDSPTESTHKFTTPIYCTVTTHSGTATSDTINIDVYELWIKHFKDAATGKAWKVCVGADIDYEAISSSDCTRWQWDMEDGFPDAWNPTGGTMKSGRSMKIPYADLSRASNSWFGDVYGTVNVLCYDAEGNKHHKYSTNMRGNAVKADVFFPPDVNVDGGTPSSSKPPCWFVFWKDGNVVNTMNSTQWSYKIGLYGAYSGNIIYLGPSAWTTNSGNETRLNRRTSAYVTFTGSGDYLDCVSETMVHEKYHSYSDNTWGGVGIRTGHTDSDGLPDTQEDTPSTYNGAIFSVTFPNNSDTYSYGYPPTSGGNDYNDQEIRCRIVELNGKLSIDKSKDWAAYNKNPKW